MNKATMNKVLYGRIWLAVSLLLIVVFGTLSVVFDNFRFIVFALPMIAFGLANGVVFGQRRRR